MVLVKLYIKKLENIFTEYFKNKENFDLEDEIFNITKIHNNKIH